MGQARGRQNGKAPRHRNTPRPNQFWECPNCGFRIKGTRYEIEKTQGVHCCPQEGLTWQPR